MSTPDKCPHCGAPVASDTTLWFECNSHVKGSHQSAHCRERAAHAETRKGWDALRQSRDEANERLAALNEWLDCHKGELEAAKADAESWRQQAERFGAQLLEKAEELKREREKWEKLEAFLKTRTRYFSANIVLHEMACLEMNRLDAEAKEGRR